MVIRMKTMTKLLKKEVSSLRKCVNEAVGHCDIDMHVEQQQLMPHLSSKKKVAQDLVRHSLSSEPRLLLLSLKVRRTKATWDEQ